MKKFWLGSVALCLLSAGAALATDMPIKEPVYKAVAPFSWEGLYVGVHAGYGWGEYKIVDSGNAESAKLNPTGWLGGFQIGHNGYLTSNWVLGSEIDFSFADIKDNGFTTPGAFAVTTKIDYLGTARVRLGYAMDHTLLYVTAGTAWAHVKALEAPVGAVQFAPQTYHVGWTVGGGLEYAFNQRWSAKVEYLYSDLGKYTSNNGAALAPRTGDLTLSTIKAGLNYRFGDPAPSASALPVKVRATSWSWNGSYIGAHAGYAWSDFQKVDTAATTANLNPSGWLGGFQTGYNWQFAPSWLFGIETDDSFAGLKQTGVAAGGGVGPLPATVKIDEFGSVRARLGFVMDRSLIYGTGGFAWAHLKYLEPTQEAWKEYQAGWTAGAGWEYAIDPKWSAKVEYLYADFGRTKDISGGFPISTRLTTNTVKAGLNYKFDLGEFIRGR
jgi:outer membrane immunogenic protein